MQKLTSKRSVFYRDYSLNTGLGKKSMSMFDKTKDNISVSTTSSNVVVSTTASVTGYYLILGDIRFGDNISADSSSIWTAYLGNGAQENYEENQHCANSVSSIRPYQNLQVSGVFHADVNSYFKLCFFAGKATHIRAARIRVILLQRD